MLGKSEGGEFLDVTDDGFDDVAPVEQGLVEERHRLRVGSGGMTEKIDSTRPTRLLNDLRLPATVSSDQFSDDAYIIPRMPPHRPLDQFRLRSALATPEPASGIVDHAK